MTDGEEPNTSRLTSQEVRPSSPASLPWTRQDVAWLGGLCLATYFLYLPVLRFDFALDDRALIPQNPQLLSWRSVPTFFTAHLAAPFHPHSQGNYYRPFALLWLMVNRKAWGLHSLAWHLSTLTLYVLVTLAVYILARRILSNSFGAGVAATVFALHPAHVESTAWITAFPDPLTTLLAVSAFLCYGYGREGQDGRRRIWRSASWLLYAAAILTKEFAIVLPALIFAYEWIFTSARPATPGARRLAARLRSALEPTLPFMGVTALYLAARWAALKGLTHSFTPLAVQSLLATWPVFLWRHLKLLMFPVGLGPFYDVPYVTHPGLRNFAWPLAALTACALLMGWLGRKDPRGAFAAVWLLLPILPLMNLRALPQSDFIHDRFMYFPSIGFSLLVALVVERIVTARGRPFSSRACKLGVVATLAVVLGGATVYYCRFWSDDLALYTRAVRIAPANNQATNNLGAALADRGRYEDAIPLYERVLARDPNYALAQYNLGYCQYRTGRYDEARKNLARAIILSPGEPEAFVYLGLTDFRTGRIAEAVANLRQAVFLSPDSAPYRFSLGMVLKSQGDLRAARDQFAASLAVNPDLHEARTQIEEIDRLRTVPPPASP